MTLEQLSQKISIIFLILTCKRKRANATVKVDFKSQLFSCLTSIYVCAVHRIFLHWVSWTNMFPILVVPTSLWRILISPILGRPVSVTHLQQPRAIGKITFARCNILSLPRQLSFHLTKFSRNVTPLHRRRARVTFRVGSARPEFTNPLRRSLISSADETQETRIGSSRFRVDDEI